MKNLTGLWVNLSRAYEIALLGDFKIQVVFHPSYVQGFDDYEDIKNFYKDIQFVEEGDLIVEIHQPDYSKDLSKFETLTDIHTRVQSAKKNTLPSDFKNDSCNSLLKTAIDKLKFSLSKKEKVIEVAKVISQLHGSNFIEIQYLAEAIHYHSYSVDENEDDRCNPEKHNKHKLLLKEQSYWLTTNTSIDAKQITDFNRYFEIFLKLKTK